MVIRFDEDKKNVDFIRLRFPGIAKRHTTISE